MSSDNSFPSLPPIHSQGDPNSDTSQSPWNASSSAGSAHESLTLAPLDYDSDSVYLENLPFEFLPRLPDLNPPESSNSRHQAQQPPPPNQQHSLLHADAPRYQFSESPDLFDDFIEPDIDWQQDPVGPQTTSRSTRASSFVDLTEISPPPGMPPAKKRKIHTSGEGRSVRPRPQTPARGSKDTPAGQSNIDAIDVVDLIDIEDDDQYQDFKAKQQAQAIKQQQQDDANKPIKLAEFQCIICMDNPTDLTVTHCGMFTFPISLVEGFVTDSLNRPSLLLRMPPPSPLRRQRKKMLPGLQAGHQYQPSWERRSEEAAEEWLLRVGDETHDCEEDGQAGY